mgnify:CR=1 FL=1
MTDRFRCPFAFLFVILGGCSSAPPPKPVYPFALRVPAFAVTMQTRTGPIMGRTYAYQARARIVLEQEGKGGDTFCFRPRIHLQQGPRLLWGFFSSLQLPRLVFDSHGTLLLTEAAGRLTPPDPLVTFLASLVLPALTQAPGIPYSLLIPGVGTVYLAGTVTEEADQTTMRYRRTIQPREARLGPLRIRGGEIIIDNAIPRDGSMYCTTILTLKLDCTYDMLIPIPLSVTGTLAVRPDGQ